MLKRYLFSFLLVAALHISSYAQYYKGTVTDEAGKPLSGVHIYIPGSYGRGTVTSNDGTFQIEAQPYQTLNFQYIGKKNYPLQLKEKDTTNICVVMQTEITRLDEITIRKKVIIKEYVENIYNYVDDRNIFQMVAENPEYPGGTDSLKSYLNHSLKYPEQAFKNGEEGQVLVQFTINSKGKVYEPQIKRSVSPALDTEALRLVQEMPAWKPGKNRGKGVDCLFILPINFCIHKDYQQILIEE